MFSWFSSVPPSKCQISKSNRATIKQLGKFPSEVLDLLCQACGDESFGDCSVFDWHYQFQMGQESLKDDTWTGHPREAHTQ
jgi:hypothetical protein